MCAVPPMAQNVEMAWEAPEIRYMLERFGSFSTHIAFDKRGTGMSDRGLNIPGIDERVDELRAVMDAESVESAWIHGLSEGGPMAIMFASTYPDRVNGLILEGTGARLWQEHAPEEETPRAQAARNARRRAYIDGWGTPDSITLSMFAPSLDRDAKFSTWWPKYERNAANRDALETLFRLNGEMDAREALPMLQCPVLLLHRRDDRMVPVEFAYETHRLLEEAGVEVELKVLEGDEHYSFAGDVDSIVDEIERFVTGAVGTNRPPRPTHVEIQTLGGFEVRVAGEPVPTNAWGSKRARILLQRLCVAQGSPVTRDVLIEMLWPDDDSPRLGARLSVVLSAVRRVLGGAVIADRSTVRLDLEAVDLDLSRWRALEAPGDRVAAFTGEFLPERRYDDWSASTRLAVQRHFAEAAHALANTELSERVVGALTTLVELDRYDDTAHRALIRQLDSSGDRCSAHTAYDSYCTAMRELDIDVGSFANVVS